jgi:hypothetical protein
MFLLPFYEFEFTTLGDNYDEPLVYTGLFRDENCLLTWVSPHDKLRKLDVYSAERAEKFIKEGSWILK